MNFGHWITSPQLSRNCVTADPPSPAPLFRRAFECSGFTTGRVRLSGVGYHELYLNGRKVGDRVLDPAVSCYEKRVRFVTFDITEYLHPGTNVVGVILGNGWYNPSTAEVWNFFKAPWRDCVKFTIELEIDGRLVLGADEKVIPSLLEYVGLSDTGKKKARNFSLGMRQRLESISGRSAAPRETAARQAIAANSFTVMIPSPSMLGFVKPLL